MKYLCGSKIFTMYIYKESSEYYQFRVLSLIYIKYESSLSKLRFMSLKKIPLVGIIISSILFSWMSVIT